MIGNPAKGQRAIVQARYGKAGDVLSLATSYPVKAPESTEVQVKVCASSVNPIDWQMIEGNRSLIASRPFPFVPLFDLAGIVVKVGDAVTRFQVGDAVHADNKEGGGGASEFVNVPETSSASSLPRLALRKRPRFHSQHRRRCLRSKAEASVQAAVSASSELREVSAASQSRSQKRSAPLTLSASAAARTRNS